MTRPAPKGDAEARARAMGMCVHGLLLGAVPACRRCLGGHRQDCGKFSMTYGLHTPRPCNCDLLDSNDARATEQT